MMQQLLDTIANIPRPLFWLPLHLGALIFMALAHTIQEGEKAWTPARRSAFKRTCSCFMAGWVVQELVSATNFGRQYEGPIDPLRGVLEAVAFLVIEDAMLYWTHRWMHSSLWAYKHIHQLHHTTQKDVSLVNGLHLTWAEFFCAICCPGVLPLLVVPFHKSLWRVYTFASVCGVVFDHGLDLFPSFLTPFPLNGMQFHITHHEKSYGNFAGPLGIWDRVCHTRVEDREFSSRERVVQARQESPLGPDLAPSVCRAR